MAKKNTNGLSSIEDALKDIKAGKMVIVVDDPSRENEGTWFSLRKRLRQSWLTL
ncbi:hypothetical protein Dip510_001544 [Elusimicrobium posterum]